MLISKEELGSTELLFLSLREMPLDRATLSELVGTSAFAVLLLPHVSYDGELCLLPKEGREDYLPEALLVCARHLLVRRGLPLDELSFLFEGERYRITHTNHTILFHHKISKQEFTKQTISLSDCTADIYLAEKDGHSKAVLLCEDVCPLDTELLWRLCRARVPSLSYVLFGSVCDGVLFLRRCDGKASAGASLSDALCILALYRSLGRRLPELSLSEMDGVFLSLSSPCEGRIRYCHP